MRLTAWERTLTRFLHIWILCILQLPCIHCNHDRRAYKDGDVMLGGLFDLHFAGNGQHCGDLFTMGLGHAESMIFAIESVNQNPNILPNITLGYDIRDYCESIALAMHITYDLVRDSDPVCQPDLNTFNISSLGNTTLAGSKPISALVGPYNSGSAVLVGSLLQVATKNGLSFTLRYATCPLLICAAALKDFRRPVEKNIVEESFVSRAFLPRAILCK